MSPAMVTGVLRSRGVFPQHRVQFRCLEVANNFNRLPGHALHLPHGLADGEGQSGKIRSLTRDHIPFSFA